MFWTKCLIKCTYFTKPILPWKSSGCLPVIIVLLLSLSDMILVSTSVVLLFTVFHFLDGIRSGDSKHSTVSYQQFLRNSPNSTNQLFSRKGVMVFHSFNNFNQNWGWRKRVVSFYSRVLQVSFCNFRQLCLYFDGILLTWIRKQWRKKIIFLHFHQRKSRMLDGLAKLSNILAKMYEITFYHQSLANICSTKWNQFVWTWKQFQIIHIALPTEQGITAFNKVMLNEAGKISLSKKRYSK